MIIKAKYPALYRPYMQDAYQGYGGLGTSHNSSNIQNDNTERTEVFENESGETFSLRAFSRAFDNSFDSYNYIK